MSHKGNKKPSLKSPKKNCLTVESACRSTSVEVLSVTEGCYLRGVELGLWNNYAGMFSVLGSLGLRYHYQSYFAFRRGVHYYIPSCVVLVLLHLTNLTIDVAAGLGRLNSSILVSRYPERWA